ncbi:DUF6786 family protein [Puia dinghuensis]|uniref:DUF4185 domain-containing protein n=1 Tax=Puia dinghuensis TaxID=1792502 RepID=A0A8J2UIA3_9BACT|nr:DUF6786 family protein [Puia dinghuensis]GGB19847.1 hypothetical protein GCM10011511_49510 [Puia dinghuensis]
MNTRLFAATSCIIMLASSCNNGSQPAATPAAASVEASPGSFAYDLSFLQHHDSVIVLGTGEARVVVSPKYQGKVFTSTAAGDSGTSFGWIHYKAFEGPADPHMNAYGGENRLWLGPEGGKFSLFFLPGAKMEFANWKTPAAFDTEAWTVAGRDERSVRLKKTMTLINYAGTTLSIGIERSVTLLDRAKIDSMLSLTADADVKAVGYRTVNTLTNTGDKAWTETTGMPCMWLLDMFNPSPATTIVIPYSGDTSKPATTDYFGEISADRIKYQDNILFFKADGKSRGKLGIHPQRAKPVAGSYDPQHHVLTITLFNVDGNARYLNQEWNTVKPPFSGDAVNAYNDGPLADGSQMGPFYELESVSPAALLGPGQSLTHWHSVFHFVGSEAGLDMICRKVLGVSITKIKGVF